MGKVRKCFFAFHPLIYFTLNGRFGPYTDRSGEEFDDAR